MENFPEKEATIIYTPPMGNRIFFALGDGTVETRSPTDLSLMETIKVNQKVKTIIGSDKRIFFALLDGSI